MEPGARKAARDAELRPLMEDFGGMGAGQLPLASPKLALHRALQYAVEFWPYVMNVLVCVQLVVAGLVTMIFRV